jgi:hypothetical protein
MIVIIIFLLLFLFLFLLFSHCSYYFHMVWLFSFDEVIKLLNIKIDFY